MGPLAWKIMGTGGAVLAGVLATKVVDLIWSRAVQDDVHPHDPQAPNNKAGPHTPPTAPARGPARVERVQAGDPGGLRLHSPAPARPRECGGVRL